MDAAVSRNHDIILDAFLDLLAEREADRISLADIAGRAGVSLAALAAAFPDKGAMFEAFSRRIDAEVLGLDASDMATEAPRERVFDVMMSRIDALRPYRRAIASLMRSVRRDPVLALHMNALAVRSHAFMLAQAGIDATGWRGGLAAQAMAVLFARVLGVFVREDDPGLPRTMAALDRELRAAERRYLRAARWTGPLVRDRAHGVAAAAAADVASAPAPSWTSPEPAAPAAPSAGEPPATPPSAAGGDERAPPQQSVDDEVAAAALAAAFTSAEIAHDAAAAATDGAAGTLDGDGGGASGDPDERRP